MYVLFNISSILGIFAQTNVTYLIINLMLTLHTYVLNLLKYSTSIILETIIYKPLLLTISISLSTLLKVYLTI